MTDWIDVTVPIRRGMVHWPGNPGVEVKSTTEEVGDGGVCRVSTLSLGVHTGTHVDAPNHFGVSDGGVESLPIDSLVGPARVAFVEGKVIGRKEVQRLALEPGSRILFKTSNSGRCWRSDGFVPDYVHLDRAGAEELRDRKVRMVGVDYLSVGGHPDGAATHRVLLGADTCILEGLDLRRVDEGAYDLIALPLLIPGSDGAPARVLLRRR